MVDTLSSRACRVCCLDAENNQAVKKVLDKNANSQVYMTYYTTTFVRVAHIVPPISDIQRPTKAIS